MLALEAQLAAGDPSAGIKLGEAIADWSALGGYELEGHWDASCRRIVRASFDDIAERPARTLSGGERKQLVLDVLFASDADVLLLDEPDNFLDIPAKLELEQRIRSSKKTIVMISHDRAVLAAALGAIVTLEGNGAWVHGDSYATYAQAREDRQRRLGDAVKRWHEEERRLFRLMKTFKERARYAPDWAKRADAMETRWNRFRAPGPAAVARRRPGHRRAHPRQRLGADRARHARAGDRRPRLGRSPTRSTSASASGSSAPTARARARSCTCSPGCGSPTAASCASAPGSPPASSPSSSPARTSPARSCWTSCMTQRGELQAAMAALARYGLAEAARRSYDVLSGGEKARLEVLILELEGHNLLLLDEPTDNLDTDSSEALETALDGFVGTVVAVSHDRAFLSRWTASSWSCTTAACCRSRPTSRRSRRCRPGSRGRRPPRQASLALRRGRPSARSASCGTG